MIKAEDLKQIQKHLLNHMCYLKAKSLKETKVEELVELEVEIMSVKNSIKKIGEWIK